MKGKIMKVTIVYDNEVSIKAIGLKSDWGFACLIETSQDTILFDTGANGHILLQNMAILQKNPSDIREIVISHEHTDHSGGLPSLYPFLKNSEIYRLKHNSTNEIMRTICVEKPQELSKNIWTTGPLKGPTEEQALVLKGKDGCYVVTGCSHPGVETILLAAQKIGTIIGILGGFHNFQSYHVLDGLTHVCPCHCTRYKNQIKQHSPHSYIPCGVGLSMEI
jgi:7,8-dihydropterin-6-yl-methyl-4-(beta-D-ribofuranosyl)aminobenzene 5'-phosphate synthase